MVKGKKDKSTIKQEADKKAKQQKGENMSANSTKKVAEKQNKKADSSKKLKKEKPISDKEKMKKDLEALNDKYLRLYSEFDNYRKRVNKERIELIKNASEDVIIQLLPVIDDFERALKSFEDTKEVNALKEGIDLIYQKMKKTFELRGLKEIDAIDKDFSTDVHEAVTEIPAPSKEQKGKVIDQIEKGYQLNEKVIRYSKVVVGS